MPPMNPPASGVGLGYGIAIAVSILILISTIMLASYICIRSKSARRDDATSHGGVDSPASEVKLGLDRPIIESYPRIVLGDSKRLPRPNNGPCSICLCDYEAREPVRCIPECNHCFHAYCVDEWLKASATCPLCRNSPAPSRLATPLSDFVSLGF
ncbi:unnamed protein product [Cochlearia groenlandica]